MYLIHVLDSISNDGDEDPKRQTAGESMSVSALRCVIGRGNAVFSIGGGTSVVYDEKVELGNGRNS